MASTELDNITMHSFHLKTFFSIGLTRFYCILREIEKNMLKKSDDLHFRFSAVNACEHIGSRCQQLQGGVLLHGRAQVKDM